MVRFCLIALLVSVAAIRVGFGNPFEDQIPLPTGIAAHHMFTSWEYSDCGGEEDAMKIRSIAIDPDPPQRDQDLTVTLLTDACRTIKKGAWVDVTVKLGLVKILSKRFDFCEQARKTNVSSRCPYHPGSYIAQRKVTLPAEIPPGKFSVDARGYNADKQDLFCLDIIADFS